MSTFRVNKKRDFVSIANQPITDKRLSWAARGLLVYLLSKPDNWTVRMDDLVKQSPLGRAGTRKLVKELIEAGYMKRERAQNPTSKQFTWTTNVYETPDLSNDEKAIGHFAVDGSAADGEVDDVVKTESAITEQDSSATADAPPAEKPKTEYIRISEHLEAVFSEARGCNLPDWRKDPKAANKRWRLPLNRMLTRAADDLDKTIAGVRAVTERMRADGLTFDAPDQIEKSFNSWLIDGDHGGRVTPRGF